MTRLAPTASCALVALLVALAVFGGGSAPASAQSTATIAGTQIAPDDVSLRIALRPNGTAAWEVEYRVRLDDENETEAFESVRSDIRANESPYISEFGSRMDATASTAENSTERSMSVENVDVSASRQQLPQEYGIITYSFTWTNFSAVEDGQIRAGDALAGFFLDGETSLLVTWPEGYEAESVSPDPNDRRTRTIVWHGPIDFGPGEPTLVLTETPPAESSSATATQASADEEGSSGNSVAVLGALALLAVGIVGGGWTLYRRYEGEQTPRDAEPSGRASATGGDDSTAPRETNDSEAPDESATGDVSAGGAGDAGDVTGDDADEMPWEDELLSNEERVLALVEHEGGRLKQQEVAQTLDWTDAKTSQVVRKMRDAGTLEAFRLGRENVLVLPEESDDGPGAE
ncbi:hypothetical protein SAMN04488063_1802 [Halopelagius inordinatus]|uniref:IclR helix-turn-helix domain-containing protein n=1 Tax=Halopelagius inordinatus TaxID=553467 RepID=A0A1I2R6Q2_9EURY|nr:hypothetical protein [Halopelagius inordinatus]SFG36158.1 hypothetical protein SAMN04488063_1802 [Halopelagius inordinatus]